MSDIQTWINYIGDPRARRSIKAIYDGIQTDISAYQDLIIGPNTQYYVDQLNGSDGGGGFDGKSWSKAFASIAYGISVINGLVDWSAKPYMQADLNVAPGLYAENLTSMPYGGTIRGFGNASEEDGHRSVTIQPASGSPVDCTSIINCRIENLRFRAPSDDGTEVLFQADTFNSSVMAGCHFKGVQGGATTTKGFEITKEMNESVISGGKFNNIRNALYLVGSAGKQISNDVFEYIYITNGDQTGFHFAAAAIAVGTVINHCNVDGGSQTLALGLDDDSDEVHVYNSSFEATANDPASGAGKYNNCYLNGGLIT